MPNPLKKRYRYSSRFTVVREVLHNFPISQSDWSLPLLGNKPKIVNFDHQTVSRREVCMGWARDYPGTDTEKTSIGATLIKWNIQWCWSSCTQICKQNALTQMLLSQRVPHVLQLLYASLEILLGSSCRHVLLSQVKASVYGAYTG